MTEVLNTASITAGGKPIDAAELQQMFDFENSDTGTPSEQPLEELDTREVSPIAGTVRTAGEQLAGFLERREVNKAHTAALNEYRDQDYDGYIDQLEELSDPNNNANPQQQMYANRHLDLETFKANANEFKDKQSSRAKQIGSRALKLLSKKKKTPTTPEDPHTATAGYDTSSDNYRKFVQSYRSDRDEQAKKQQQERLAKVREDIPNPTAGYNLRGKDYESFAEGYKKSIKDKQHRTENGKPAEVTSAAGRTYEKREQRREARQRRWLGFKAYQSATKAAFGEFNRVRQLKSTRPEGEYSI